ncbi:MAG: hypothetical protein V2A74_04335 [bacterium]
MTALDRSGAAYNRITLRCVSIALLLFLAGCSTVRLEQFSQFAAAGQTYTAALPKLLDIALQSTIEASSTELIEIRGQISDPDERANILDASDKEIRRRVQAFQVIKTQTNLLGAYFMGLAALAESDAGEGIAKSTLDAAEALDKIGKGAATLKIGEAPVKDVLGDIVPIVVAAFNRARLEEVLETTAESVGRSIDIHIALLEQLSVVIRGEQEVVLGTTKLKEVDRKYRDAGALPAKWKTRRAELLLKQARLGELEEALKAAQKLKLAFVDLVENENSSTSLTLLLQDMQRLTSLAELISGKGQIEGE